MRLYLSHQDDKQQRQNEMNTVFTAQELIAKGFTKKQVSAMLKKCETRVNFYVKQYIANGNKCSVQIQKSWDAECARFDHLKSTLSAWA